MFNHVIIKMFSLVVDHPYLTLKKLRTLLKGYKYSLTTLEHYTVGFSKSIEPILAGVADER